MKGQTRNKQHNARGNAKRALTSPRTHARTSAMQRSAHHLTGSEEAREISAAKKPRLEATGALSGALSPSPPPPPSIAEQLQATLVRAFSGPPPPPRVLYIALESMCDGPLGPLCLAFDLEGAMRAVRERVLEKFGDELRSYCLYCFRTQEDYPDDDREARFGRYSAWVANGRAVTPVRGEDKEEEANEQEDEEDYVHEEVEAFVGFEAAFTRLQAGKAGAEAEFNFEAMQNWDGTAAMFSETYAAGGGGGGGGGAGAYVSYRQEIPQHPEPRDEMPRDDLRAVYMVVTTPPVQSCTSAQLLRHVSQLPCMLGCAVSLDATVARHVASFVGPPPVYLAMSYKNDVQGCCGNRGLTIEVLGVSTSPQEARCLLRHGMPSPPQSTYIGEQEGGQREAGEEEGEGEGEDEGEEEDFDLVEIQGAIDSLKRGDAGSECLFNFTIVEAEARYYGGYGDYDYPRSWSEDWVYWSGEGIAAEIQIVMPGSTCGGNGYGRTTLYSMISCQPASAEP
jgi:hypothetical protein